MSLLVQGDATLIEGQIDRGRYRVRGCRGSVAAPLYGQLIVPFTTCRTRTNSLSICRTSPGANVVSLTLKVLPLSVVKVANGATAPIAGLPAARTVFALVHHCWQEPDCHRHRPRKYY